MSRPRARSRNSARAVRKMIGISVVRSSSSRASATPQPSSPGIITSSRITSGRSARAVSSPDGPSPASSTGIPSASRLTRQSSLIGASSSITRTVVIRAVPYPSVSALIPRRPGADGPGCGRVAAIELAEDALLLGMRDADPLVLHAHLDRVLAATRGDRDGAAGGRVADGIVEQVEQDLGQLFPVGLRRQRLGGGVGGENGGVSPLRPLCRGGGLVFDRARP